MSSLIPRMLNHGASHSRSSLQTLNLFLVMCCILSIFNMVSSASLQTSAPLPGEGGEDSHHPSHSVHHQGSHTGSDSDHHSDPHHGHHHQESHTGSDHNNTTSAQHHGHHHQESHTGSDHNNTSHGPHHGDDQEVDKVISDLKQEVQSMNGYMSTLSKPGQSSSSYIAAAQSGIKSEKIQNQLRAQLADIAHDRSINSQIIGLIQEVT